MAKVNLKPRIDAAREQRLFRSAITGFAVPLTKFNDLTRLIRNGIAESKQDDEILLAARRFLVMVAEVA